MNGNHDIKTYYGFHRQPFASHLPIDQLYQLTSMINIGERCLFAISNALVFVIIGEIGSGKSTALRYTISHLSEKHYQILHIIGGSWSFVELLRQSMNALGVYTRTNQQTTMLKQIYEAFSQIRSDGREPVLFIDECDLFKQNVFSQLHLLCQQNPDDSRILPIVMCGQDTLFEKLRHPYARPLMSRVMNGFNLRSMSQQECIGYMKHHLTDIAGGQEGIFSDQALIAVTQASGCIPRNINTICLLALKHGMDQQLKNITPEVIRLVTKEWWQC
ncbi:MAG: AAA family ATPase [Spirochaetia bacterium]|nr:AAA family ATPase [Spirochaetia bacterium]